MHLSGGEGEAMQVETGGEKNAFSNFQKGKPKRKSGKKSRFLSKAKKFGKQGRLGKGFEVDSETYNYFLNVLEISQKNEFDSTEEKEAFIGNTFSQTEGLEVNLCSNQMISRVIETLLPISTEEILIRFTASFTPSLRVICSDPFASHVLEKLLEITSSDKWSDSKTLKDWFKQTSKYVINNFEEFVFCPYANHILRKVCQCLSGLVMPSGQNQIKAAQHQHQLKTGPVSKKVIADPHGIFGERKASKKNSAILKDFVDRFLAWPQFYDLFKTELTCGFVQTLLKSYHRIDSDKVQGAIDLTIKALGDNLDLDDTVVANVHTRTIEVCLGISAESTWNKIYKCFFKGKLIEFGLHEKGKFSLKKLIESCPSCEKFEALFDGLHPDLPKLFEAENFAVFVTIAEGCKKFETKQAPFLLSLTSILGYDNESGETETKANKKKRVESSEKRENFVLCLARFGRQFELKDDGTPMFLTDYCGTMVLQQVMEFHKPLKVISCMLEMEDPALSKLAQDPKGSHIVESFLQSSKIGKKDKEMLFSKLREYLVPLSLSKFGARVMNVIWSWASIKNKAVVAAVLSERIAQLNGNQYGKFLSASCLLKEYQTDPKSWAILIEKSAKRKLEEDNNAEDLGSPQKKKKSKRKSDTSEAMIIPDEIEPEIKEEVSFDQPKREKKRKSKKQRRESETD